jgi:hypothetical protein
VSRTLEEIRERVLGSGGAREEGMSALPPTGVWAAPTPVPPATPQVPPLDLAMLPEAPAAVIRDASERACLPADFYLPALIVTLSGMVGNRWRVRPKQHDDFTIVLNLWGALVALSGTMKTSAGRLFLGFAQAIEDELVRAYDRERLDHQARAEDLEAQEAALLDRRKKAARDQQVGELANLREELTEIRRRMEDERQPEPRLIVNDATVEKLLEILRDNQRGLIMNRDELIGFFRNLEKNGHESDRSFYLEAWDGALGFKQDRIGRGTITAPIVTLSLYGAIQPGPLREYQDAATDAGSGADGLLQRFQVLVWPTEDLPAFKLVDREPDHAAKDRLQSIYRYLFNFTPPAEGFVGFDGASEGVSYGILHFTGEAQQFYDQWIVDLENRLRSPRARAHRAYLSHLSKYRSLLPALAALFHLVDVATHETDRQNRRNPHPTEPQPRATTDETDATPTATRISLDATIRASALVDFLDEHARKVYDVEISGERHAAATLLDHLAAGHAQDGITVRDLQRKGWKGLDRERLDAALAYLEARGWVRVERLSPGEAGGRPSTIVRTHPNLGELWDEATA